MKITATHEQFKLFDEITKNYVITNYDDFVNLLHNTDYTYSSNMIDGFIELNAKNNTYKISANFNHIFNTLQIKEIINMEDFEEKILPCRKCGSVSQFYDDYKGMASEVVLQCNDCNNHETVIIYDALTPKERYSCDPDWQCPKTFIYGKKALKKAKNYIIEEWNKRVV